MRVVQSERTALSSPGFPTPNAKSISDQRSSRSFAAEPVMAPPVMRLSAAATSSSSARSFERYSAVNIAVLKKYQIPRRSLYLRTPSRKGEHHPRTGQQTQIVTDLCFQTRFRLKPVITAQSKVSLRENLPLHGAARDRTSSVHSEEGPNRLSTSPSNSKSTFGESSKPGKTSAAVSPSFEHALGCSTAPCLLNLMRVRIITMWFSKLESLNSHLLL